MLGLGWMGDGENVRNKSVALIRVQMHWMNGASAAMVVARSMLMLALKDLNYRWNAMSVEVEVQLATEEFGK